MTTSKKPAQIFYFALQDDMPRDQKLEFLRHTPFNQIEFEKIIPDAKNNWINQTDNDFDDLIPVATKETKSAKKIEDEKAIFKLFSLGVVTSRDEWVYDFDKNNLINKVKFFINIYNNELNRWYKTNTTQASNDFVNRDIKWTSELENHMKKGICLVFRESDIIESLYRPFIYKYLYYGYALIHRFYQLPSIFPNVRGTSVPTFYQHSEEIGTKVPPTDGEIPPNPPLKRGEDDRSESGEFSSNLSLETLQPFENIAICFTGHSQVPISAQVIHTVCDYGLGSRDTDIFPFYRYENNQRIENITDWALNEFKNYYNNQDINKFDIFYYVYGVLHDPKYREKYEINLKRDLPKMPYYDDFYKIVDIGKKLMNLHLNFENIDINNPDIHVGENQNNADISRLEMNLKVINNPNIHVGANQNNADISHLEMNLKVINNPNIHVGENKKPILKADKINHQIIIDKNTVIKNINPKVWNYKLGNRSAVEWILEQYKPSTPKDPTIKDQFNTYNFYDYKQDFINLILKIIILSEQTIDLINEI